MEINRNLLAEIDAIELSESNRAWREAVRSADWRIHGERQRLTLESWRATVGEDLEIRGQSCWPTCLIICPLTFCPST